MANRTKPYSSRLFVYLLIGFGAFTACCCVPHFTEPYVERDLRPQPKQDKTKGKRRTSKTHFQVSPAFSPALS
jgi:hypothetical protein